MSSHGKVKRLTVPQIVDRKGQDPIVCLTAYTAPIARAMDSHVDLILVGDSVAMVLHGMDDTLGITLDHMIMHGQAVMRGSDRALVVVDMPFGAYEESPEVAYRNAARIMQETGCTAVKMEGGKRLAETIAFITERGIPVMGHIGLLPQSVHAKGGYRIVGRDQSEWDAIEEDACAVAEAGAFAVVLEGVAEPLAVKITESIAIPTIGIGASNQCDGQILVVDDMLGLTERTPSFVKEYGQMHQNIEDAVVNYAREVKARVFPGPNHVFHMKGVTKLRVSNQ